jgi:hypothetical protein
MPRPLAPRHSRIGKKPQKKKPRSRAKKTVERIEKPLSELARQYPNVAVTDIETYVHRPVAERLREVEECKTPGKIKRPMNAFMLYRKAYQNLAKNLCTQNNHQLVSKICGGGWPVEPDHIREQFNEWAKIERANHQLAHPGYKFTPSKPRKPKRHEYDSDEGSVTENLSWTGSSPSLRDRAATATDRSSYINIPRSLPYKNQTTEIQSSLVGIHGGSLYPPYMASHESPPHDQECLIDSYNIHQYATRPLELSHLRNGELPKEDDLPGANYIGSQLDSHVTAPACLYTAPFNASSELLTLIDPLLQPYSGTQYSAHGYGDLMLDGQRWTQLAEIDGIRHGYSESFTGYEEPQSHNTQFQIPRGHENSWLVEELEEPQQPGWLGNA